MASRPAADFWQAAPARPPAPAPARVPAPPRAAPPAWRPAAAPTPRPVPSAPTDAPATVHLRYLARAPIQVRGTRSGASYRFSEQQPTQAVQRADAEALLATGHFELRRAG